MEYNKHKQNKKGSGHMTKENKKDIEETITILKQLDEKSLLLIKNGAEMLKTRMQMDNKAS